MAVQPTRTRLSADDRRDQILAAARTAFLRAGYAGTRIRDISEEAGVNEALLYRHFESKAAIFDAAIAQPLEDMVERLLELGDTVKRDPGEAPLRRDTVEKLLGEVITMMGVLTPLLGVVLFGDQERGQAFYANHLTPALERLGKGAFSAVTAWSDEFAAKMVVVSGMGTALMFALDERFGGTLAEDRDRVVAFMANSVVASASGP